LTMKTLCRKVDGKVSKRERYIEEDVLEVVPPQNEDAEIPMISNSSSSNSPSVSCCYNIKPENTEKRMSPEPERSKRSKLSSVFSRKGSVLVNKNESETSSIVESANKDVAALWEECFDLSEHLESVVKEVRSTKIFWTKCNVDRNENDEDRLDLKDLHDNICNDLEKISLDEIVHGLQGTIFKKKAKETVDAIPLERYLEVLKVVRMSLRQPLNQSFNLFLQSIER